MQTFRFYLLSILFLTFINFKFSKSKEKQLYYNLTDQNFE